jgi:hypothetical protein
MPTPKKTPLSWKPLARGNRYCAPACGRGCTRAEFQLAHRRGVQLADSLGDGWSHLVWENLGWHYKAVSPCGRIAVYPSPLRPTLPQDPYTAYLGDGRFSAIASEPAEAIKQVILLGRAAEYDLRKLMDGLSWPGV